MDGARTLQVSFFGISFMNNTHHCSSQPLIARLVICHIRLLRSAVQHNCVFMIPQLFSPSSLGNKCRQQVIVYSNFLEPLIHHASSIVALIRTNALLEFATWSILGRQQQNGTTNPQINQDSVL